MEGFYNNFSNCSVQSCT